MALHQNLTGADLHEPKGAATATINKVYVSDGSGSGAWTALPFSNNLLHVRDQRASGTNGQTITTGSYQKRELQTSVTNEITSASLASHQITLPAGTYYAEIKCTVGTGSATNLNSKIRLYNTTTSATLLSGIGTRFGTSATGFQTDLVHSISGRFTLAGASVLELQDYTNSTAGTVVGGLAYTTGDVEVYADVLIWKI